MAGYPPPYVQYVPQTYYAAGYIPQQVQPALSVPQPQLITQPWVEHLSSDGRKYYCNTLTNVTTWEKPEELQSEAERLLALCPWKEFKSDTGKVYYYNSQTKESVWTKPAELIVAEQKASAAPTTILNMPSVPTTGSVCTPITPATPAEDTKTSEPSALDWAMQATLASIDKDVSTPKAETKSSAQIPLPPLEDKSRSETNLTNAEDLNMTQAVASPVPVVAAPVALPEYKTRGEMAEGLRRLFREKEVPGNATWEQALKLIGDDPRFVVLRGFIEKKQIFNVYKTQRLKEEKEEQRMQAKINKENLEKFLLHTKKIHSTMSYRKVDHVLSDVPEWTSVPEYDRRHLLQDAMEEITKREKEEARALRKRNIKVFNEILNSMPDLNYRTTWSEAQHMLLDNARFTGDKDLQNLDKEDALICFEEHIRMLEREHDEEKERGKRKLKRAQRKNREAFIVLLDEMHEKQLLTSTTLWKDVFAIINRDERFHTMLAQRGSTPLDLFKFYVENLKSRFPLDKKLIKELLKETGYAVYLSSTFDSFREFVQSDERGKNLDVGNIRLTFDSLLEKAQGRERERQREDARRLKKQEQAFCDMLRQAGEPAIRTDTTWEEIIERFSANPAFQAIPLESERIRVFKEYLIDLDAVETGAGVYTGDYDSKSSKSRRNRSRKHRSSSRDGIGDSHSDFDGQGDSISRKSRSKHSHRRHRNHHLKSGDEAVDVDNQNSSTDHDKDDTDRKSKRKSKSKKSSSSRHRHKDSSPSIRSLKHRSRHGDDGEKKKSKKKDRKATIRQRSDSLLERVEEDVVSAGDNDDFAEASKIIDDQMEASSSSRRNKSRHRKSSSQRQRQTSIREDGEADSLSEEEGEDDQRDDNEDDGEESGPRRRSTSSRRQRHHRS